MKVVKAAAAALVAVMLLTTPVWAAEKEASNVQVNSGPEVIVQDGTAGQLPPKVELNKAQQKVLEKIYECVPELKELVLESVHDEGDIAWGVTFSDRNGAVEPGIHYAHAYLNFDKDTDQLINMNIHNPKWASEQLPATDLAEEKAAAFAQKLLGDKMNNYRMGSVGYGGGGTVDEKGNMIYWANANVQFNRLINGVPFMNSGFQVSVDVAGHVTAYYSQDFHKNNDGVRDVEPELGVFPDPSLAVTKEKAEKAFAEQLEMKLSYVGRQPLKDSMFNREKVETRPVLTYSPSYPSCSVPIDAMTGKPLDGLRERLPLTSPVKLAGEGKKLAAGTPEEVASLLAAETGIDMSGMKFGSVVERESEGRFVPGVKVKEYNWMSEPQTGPDGKPDFSTMRYLHVTTLADTGQVVSFNLQDESGRGEQAAITQEAARKTALRFMQKHLEKDACELEMSIYSTHEENIPDWVDRSKLEGYEQRPYFHFCFTRTHQGIPVSDSSYSVTVDGLTGKITSFVDVNSASSVTLPDSKNIVTAEAAKAEYLKSKTLNLVYLWPEYYNQKAPKPYLIYIPENAVSWEYIDAFTGKMVIVERD